MEQHHHGQQSAHRGDLQQQMQGLHNLCRLLARGGQLMSARLAAPQLPSATDSGQAQAHGLM